MAEIPDGLVELRSVLSLRQIMSLIEATARWAPPEAFSLLPVWFPEYSRGQLLYKGNWSEAQTNTKRSTGHTAHKSEANVYASKALTLALGLSQKQRTNWSCCHIWGIDDPTYQRSNLVVQDRRFFSCIGNMVLLPTPLKAFTDAMPEVKAMLRICAHHLYGWRCDHEDLLGTHKVLDGWQDWDSYPSSWPRAPREKKPLGVVEFSPTIAVSAERRITQIMYDLGHAGNYYPRDEVKAALDYWKMSL